MQAVIQRASSGPQTQQVLRTDLTTRETAIRRLTAEFPELAAAAIERCVTDTLICAEHLGLAITASLIERVAREHLLGVLNAVPPSGTTRCPYGIIP